MYKLGLKEIGSVLFYIRETLGHECQTKNPLEVPCLGYAQDLIDKDLHIGEGLLEYSYLKPDSVSYLMQKLRNGI